MRVRTLPDEEVQPTESGEKGTKEEEDKVSKESSGRVEPALGTVRDYTTLPELHGSPRGASSCV